MKTPKEFVSENEGYAFEEAIANRDDEVRATVYRELAELSISRGGWIHRQTLLDMADKIDT